MKKVWILSFLIILFSFILNSCQTFDGYYHDLAKVRSNDKFYGNIDYLFTKDLGETIVDFIIEDHILHIVEIKVKDYNSDEKYKMEHSSSYSLESAIYKFEQIEDYCWLTTSKLSLNTVSWCVVNKDFNYNNDNHSSFEFIYKDVVYCLCYNINVS